MGDEEGHTRRAGEALRKFACEGEGRCGQEEDTSVCSKAEGREEGERERLSSKRKRAYSWTNVPQKVGGHRLQSTGGRIRHSKRQMCDGGGRA